MSALGKFLLGLLLALGLAGRGQAEAPLWLRYPAISPDGKTIVFCYQGDLFRVPAAGGEAVALTRGEGHHLMPVWSHDGKSLAFASDRHGNFDIFVMPVTGGEARRLTFHSSNELPSAFTPDDREVLFTSARTGTAENAQFPGRLFPQTYTVPVTGGQPRLVSTVPMELGVFDPKGERILFQDLKGYEDPWRKHHTSAVTRDIGLYDRKTGTFRTLTTFKGEDRNPVFAPDGDSFYYLSEQSGTLNVTRGTLSHPGEAVQVTRFQKHPVRFLTQAQDRTLCFAWNGEVYTLPEGGQPKKLEVRLSADGRGASDLNLPINAGITEMAVSPSGKEIAFVARGEVFVTSVEGGITKRITDTAAQERSVSFSPDGRTLLYASERGGSWDLYTSSIVRKDEPCFYAATLLQEKAILATPADEFQPLFSPDGKEVAYLHERTGIHVLNLESGKTRVLYPAAKSYSYSDGDQDFRWTPDGKWIFFAFDPQPLGGIQDVGLLAADGSGKLVNLSRSGFNDGRPRLSPDGTLAYWTTDREGHRKLDQDPATADIFGIFLTQKAWDRFQLTKEEFALVKEREDKEAKDVKKDDKDAKKEDKKPVAPLGIDWEGLEQRKARLTLHTADLGEAVLDPKGEKLIYLAKFEKGYDLWTSDLRTKETKVLVKLDAKEATVARSEDGKALFVLADGRLSKVDAESGKRDPVVVNGEMVLRPRAERAYIFEHAWRQVQKKFYVADLHGVDWKGYREAYARFLPHIRNNYDFAELLSEMLGELNASHTGCRYAPPQENTDQTASLGLFFDPKPVAKGLRVSEILAKGPLDSSSAKVRTGHVLTAIDGRTVAADEDLAERLNRKAGKFLLLSFLDPASGATWDEPVKAIALPQEGQLLYRRWVERNRATVERLSGGRLGYVHVRGMDDPSMRTVFEEVLGRYADKEALVVDTRFNGGGNLHEVLSDFLSGKKYFDIIPHGQPWGYEPLLKWIKPSIVVMGEGNYSDAHLFPVAYKLKGLGKTVGMPVPGTGTFVWWEPQIDRSLVFGIPEGGWRTPDGAWCENTQLEPDIRVANNPAALASGTDAQLKAAVDALLAGLNPRQK
jgi:Tol biopolymer transport system component/C-terminal processing protease CtpA/Prc